MSMIFPGMDPYLEHPALWMGVHNALIVYLRDQLRPKLRPRYIPAIEERVYIEDTTDIRPDVEILRASARRRGGAAVATVEADDPIRVLCREDVHEPYVTILDLQNAKKVVAVIEVLSPTNKYAGPGRDSYLAKQREVLSSDAHLVEIDLLRLGPHVLAVPEMECRWQIDYDYLTCVNPAGGHRRAFDLYPSALRARLPRVAIPLAGDDPPVVLDLQEAMERVCEEGSYLDRINYLSPCIPRLPPEAQTWADGLIAEAADLLPPLE